MSGPIVDMPIRVCQACQAVYMEDDRMYQDTNICPNCGNEVGSSPLGNDSGEEIYAEISTY